MTRDPGAQSNPPADGDAPSDQETCTLCDLPVDGRDAVASGGSEVVAENGAVFCCVGCRDVHDALGEIETVDAADVRDAQAAGEDGQIDETPSVPEDHEATFLEIDGMHCATCEAFIESAASAEAGVSAASASYVTDTVRIDHDPETVSAADLQAAVTGLGYKAYPRDDAFSRRQADHFRTVRLAVGVLVGMMVMLQYIAIIYPTYFDGLFYDERTAEFLADAMAHSSGTYFFILIGVLTTIVLLVTGKPILRGAYVSVKTRAPNMDLLVAIAALSAYLYSTLAIIVGGQHIYYDVTVAIIVIVTIGTHYESSLKEAAAERLSDLTAVQVDEARRLTGEGGEEMVVLDALDPGDHVLVRAGERVPVDGEVIEGDAAVDEAVVTGESLPVRKTAGDAVVGGSVVADGVLTVAVGEDATSSLDRISELVWDLQSSTHGIQKLADRLATIFVPLVLVLAVVVTATYLALGAGVAAALLIGLTVLIVSCPCALGLATPLAVAAGLRDALERSIVVFDDSVFERLREADTVVFDKTGTLTTGEMSVLDSTVDDDLLAAAAALERRSAHPVGMAIAAAGDTGETIHDETMPDGGLRDPVEADVDPEADEAGIASTLGDAVESFESHDRGVGGIVDGDEILVGHPDLFADRGWTVPEDVTRTVADARDTGRVPVAVGRNGSASGVVVVGDQLRPGWQETMTRLADDGVTVVVLTGDDARAAALFRETDAIDQVFAGVPPEGKAETVARLQARGEVVMVGDGTNDAPALAAADLGVALGGGTALAADAADVAIVDDDLASVETIFDLARGTDRRVKGNIGWAFLYNAIAIPLAVTGLLNPLFAAAAMATSSTLVTLNSSRSIVAADDGD